MGGCRLAMRKGRVCHKSPAWRMLRLVFWACSSVAPFSFCGLLNRLQIGVGLLSSLFRVSPVLFLEVESVNFLSDAQINLIFFDRLIFIVF